jgi:lycopene beta-cyclase
MNFDSTAMMERMRADLIMVGGGLANTLIALRLSVALPEIKVMILEQGDALGGNHTWSFHGADLTAAQLNWIKPLVQYSWRDYDVKFPGRKRTLKGSYHSITSEHLDSVARSGVSGTIKTNTEVTHIAPESVVLANGSRLATRAVIDGRGPQASPHLDVRFQKFVGRIVRTAKPHYVTRPIIMDATGTQDDGYRFFYTLPFDAHTLLIEDTRYSDGPVISAGEYGNAINDYAAAQGWTIVETLREENGVLPITLGGDIKAFWDDQPGVPRSGLHAALFHPATGYSLPDAVRLADELAAKLAMNANWTAEDVYTITRNASVRQWQLSGFYRVLNRMLFLAAAPAERRHVLERFYGLNSGLISRFYAGTNTNWDKLRILSGKPPVKLGKAWQAVFKYRPDAGGK